MIKNEIINIKKRNGRIVAFDQEKIANVIFKAITATGQGDGKKSKQLSNKVVEILKKQLKKNEIPQVEQIQDIVEEVLIEQGLAKTAKAYILYREQRRRIREVKTAEQEAVNKMEQYVEKNNWEVKENANVVYSLQGLSQYIVGAANKKYWLNKIYPPEIRKAQEQGDLHIHKLKTLSSYCGGWDFYDLLLKGFGGVAGKLQARPAKHFDAALGQIVNFMYALQLEAPEGAVAFSNFDTLLAPFVRHDNLSYSQVKQAMQHFLFDTNIPSREGLQSFFSNLTFDVSPSPVFANQPVIIGGKPQKKIYAEFQEEINMINRAFYEVATEGDAHSRTFSVDGACFCPIKNSEKIKLVKIGEYIDDLMQKREPVSIKANNCQILDVRDQNLKCLGLKHGIIDWQKINFLVRHPLENLLRIWTQGGFNIKLTPSHSVLVLKDGQIQNFEASKLQKGDYLITPKSIPLGVNKISRISLAEEFVKKGKEKGIYIRDVFKNGGRRLRQSRIYKNSVGHLSIFPLSWIADKLNNFVLLKAKINLAGSNIRISNYLSISNELVEFLGWYCAEGSAEKGKNYGGISLGFNLKKEQKTAHHVANLVRKVCPDVPIAFRQIKKRNLIEIRIHSKLLRRIITEIFEIGNKEEKRVPEIIFESSPEMKKIFLKAYFAGDAKITNEIIAVSSISRELIYGVSTLLKQLNIFHTLTEYHLRRKPQWRVNIWRNRELNAKESYTISKIPIKESGLEKIVEKVLEKEPRYYDTLGRKYKNTRNRIFNKFGIDYYSSFSTSLKKIRKLIDYAQSLKIEIPPALKEIEKDNLLFFKIKKIEETKTTKGLVYDFSTESENFVADQFLVHNTFPIPTINITKDFPWNEKALEPMWDATAKYGINYFGNYINSDMRPEDVRSLCCRLRLDKRELYNRGGGGLFGAGALTGSIGYTTINMSRIGYLSKNKKEFFGRLEKIMDLAKGGLEIKRKALEDFTEKGLYPYSKFWLSGIKKMRNQYWANHFSTIGLIGMNEALLNFMNKDIGSSEGKKLALETLDFMRKKLVQYQEETGNLYNLEQSPAEGTSYRLALKDKQKYPDIITAGTKETPYYTNSTNLSVGYTDDVFEALELQDEILQKYNGGSVFHVFLGEKLQSGEQAKRLVKKIFENFRLPYISITPTFSICPIHGYLNGEHFTCPKCTIEQPCEVYSRIVGYVRPLSQWNAGKRVEWEDRQTFKL